MQCWIVRMATSGCGGVQGEYTQVSPMLGKEAEGHP